MSKVPSGIRALTVVGQCSITEKAPPGFAVREGALSRKRLRINYTGLFKYFVWVYLEVYGLQQPQKTNSGRYH